MKSTAKIAKEYSGTSALVDTTEESVRSNRIIGAAMEVHRQLGPGLLESGYERALAYELTLHDIPFERQKPSDAVT